MPRRNQEARLTQILTENNLLQDGRIVKRDDTPPAVVDEIIDIAFYLEQDVSPLAAEVFDENFRSMHESFFFYGTDFTELSIEGYHTLIRFDTQQITDEGFLVLTRTDGTEERIDLTSYAEILVQYGNQHDNIHLLSGELQDYKIGNYLIHFENISIHKAENGTVVWDNTQGFVLVR